MSGEFLVTFVGTKVTLRDGVKPEGLEKGTPSRKWVAKKEAKEKERKDTFQLDSVCTGTTSISR
jgi:hypothetical protein